MKKHLIIITCILLSFVTLGACESLHENAGELAGMWQLTLWTESSGDTLATNESGIYYCVQRNLMKFQQADASHYHLSYYTHTPDSLIIYHPIDYPGDTLVNVSVLSLYGVPADGRFLIRTLTEQTMVLESSQSTLFFRKY